MTQETRDDKCSRLQQEIHNLLVNEGLTLRDVCGILDMLKHYFLMGTWDQLEHRQ